MTQAITSVERVIYTATANTKGGRDGGASRTSDGRLEGKLSVPGTPGTGTIRTVVCRLLIGLLPIRAEDRGRQNENQAAS